ncbi:MAG: hypothetical protein KDK34_00675, partial [Leptospiraceae bacterium]|nr:hypothetical protein [Leptospiraceae bacterium]
MSGVIRNQPGPSAFGAHGINLMIPDVQLEYRTRTEYTLPEVFQQLGYVLEARDMGALHGPLRALLTELINNAFKANLKRMYFEDQGLRLDSDYQQGMDGFRRELERNSGGLMATMAERSHTVRVVLGTQADSLRIEVENSVGMHPSERQTVTEILSQVQRLQSHNGDTVRPVDRSEGGGLGLKMAAFMVANLGWPAESLNFATDEEFTRFELRIPRLLSEAKARETEIPDLLTAAVPLLPVAPLAIQNLRRCLESTEPEHPGSALDADPLLLLNLAVLCKGDFRSNMEANLRENREVLLEYIDTAPLLDALHWPLADDLRQRANSVTRIVEQIDGLIPPGNRTDELLSEWIVPAHYAGLRLLSGLDPARLAAIREHSGRHDPIVESGSPRQLTLGVDPRVLIRLWVQARSVTSAMLARVLPDPHSADPGEARNYWLIRYADCIYQSAFQSIPRREFDFEKFFTYAENN